MIRAGTLDRVITIVRRGAATDNGLEEVPGEWQILATRRASVKPLFRKEEFDSDGREARRELTAWMHYDSVGAAVTALDAVVMDGRLYELTAEPLELGRREGIELRMLAADPAVAVDVGSLAAVP